MIRKLWLIKDIRVISREENGVPDRKQYAKKDACGSKMKVNKCGFQNEKEIIRLSNVYDND